MFFNIEEIAQDEDEALATTSCMMLIIRSK